MNTLKEDIMTIVQKSLVLSLLIIFSSFVVADSRDLDICVDTCKSNFEHELTRSPCIQGCKDKYGFDEKDDCQEKCKSLEDKEARGECMKTCKPHIEPRKADSPFDNCDAYCNEFWMSATPACPGEMDTSGTYPECECGWECDDEEEIFKEYEDEKLEQKAGSLPGSPFYFIDRFFDRFGDEIAVKEERIAEIKELIEAGDLEAAKGILKDYMELADEVEDELDPERKEDVKRSAAAIRNAMKDIRDRLPPGERGEFVSEIMRKEHSIATAAEISSKIKELCEDLSELDPLEYSRVCKTEEDSPTWQKKLDEKLTEDQIEEAKKFGKIMAECFSSSGRDCACNEIPFPDFANACSRAAPLAAACEEGDGDSCSKLDTMEMPRLPPHLQEVMETLEGRDVMESKFDVHMPPECAGVTSPQACKKIMITEHAPEECREALLAADVESEHESRKICDTIMMEKHAPECSEKGITSPEECARFMDSFRGDHRGPRIDFNCKKIEDAQERLACFDKASSQAKGYKGHDDEDYEGPCMTEDDWKAKKKECKELYGDHAGDEPIMGDSGEGYECVIDASCVDFRAPEDNCLTDEDWKVKKAECRALYGDNAGDKPIMGDSGNGYRCAVDIECIEFKQCGDCERECSKGGQIPSRTDCVNDECQCYYDDRGPGCGDCASACEEVEGKLLSHTDCVNDRCECYYRVESECKDGCHQECGDQNSDCVNEQCVCLGYTEGDASDTYDPDDYPHDSNGDSTDIITLPDDEGHSDDSRSESGSSDGSSDSDSGSDSSNEGSSGSDESNSDSGSSDSDDKGSNSDSGSDERGSSDSKGGESSSDSDDSGMDAITGNSFVDYWYG